MTTIFTKHCLGCCKDYPATTEYFSKNKDGKFGLHSQCKMCRSQYNKNWREENAERHAKNARTWQENNREKVAAKTQRWRERHPERVKEYTESRDKNIVRDAMRRWRKRNPDHKYVRTPEQIKAGNNRRRMRTENAEGNITATDIRRQYESQNGKCWWCGCELNGKYHMDHVIPLSRGGENGPENIVASCPPCNLSKGSRLPQEWCARLF